MGVPYLIKLSNLISFSHSFCRCTIYSTSFEILRTIYSTCIYACMHRMQYACKSYKIGYKTMAINPVYKNISQHESQYLWEIIVGRRLQVPKNWPNLISLVAN